MREEIEYLIKKYKTEIAFADEMRNKGHGISDGCPDCVRERTEYRVTADIYEKVVEELEQLLKENN